MNRLLFFLITSFLILFLGFYPGWFDSAEFSTAAFALGVSHPSGHPLWVQLAHLFTLLPFGSIAFRTSLFSTICCTVALTFFLQLQQTFRLKFVTAFIFLLCILFHPSIGLQITRTEVYAFGFSITLFIFTFLLRWMETRDIRWWALAAFFIGLYFSLQPLLAATILPLFLILILMNRTKTVQLISLGIPFVALGLLVYLFLPLRASTHPIINWDDPSHFASFWKALTARDFQIFFHAPMSAQAKRDLLNADIFSLFPIPLLVLSVFGFWRLYQSQKTIFFFTLTGFFSTILPWLLKDFYLRNPDAHAYIMPAIFFLVLVSVTQIEKIARTSFATLVVLLALYPLFKFSIPALGAHAEQDAFLLSKTMDLLPAFSKVSAGSDHFLFPAWYRIEVEKRRPDLQIYSLAMLPASWYRNQMSAHYAGIPVQHEYAENQLPISQEFVDVCKVRLKNVDPFDIRKSVCAYVIRQTDSKSLLENLLGQSETSFTCAKKINVELPYPLVPDSQGQFLISSQILETLLYQKYLECGQVELAVQFYENSSKFVNTRLLHALSLWSLQKQEEAFDVLTPPQALKTEKGYLALARGTLLLIAKNIAEAKKELEISEDILGNIEPVKRIKQILERMK